MSFHFGSGGNCFYQIVISQTIARRYNFPKCSITRRAYCVLNRFESFRQEIYIIYTNCRKDGSAGCTSTRIVSNCPDDGETGCGCHRFHKGQHRHLRFKGGKEVAYRE